MILQFNLDELRQLELFTRRVARGCPTTREKIKAALARAKESHPKYFARIKAENAQKRLDKGKRKTARKNTADFHSTQDDA